jgi:hypothetical protein
MDPRFRFFPYREEEPLRGRTKRLPRPTVDVTLILGDLETAERSLIDTGSPRTVFSRGAGVALDIELPEAGSGAPNVKKLTFLGNDWEAISETVTLRLPPYDDLEWEAEVDFVLDESLPYGLLGHEGFLNQWAVSFNAYHSYFVVEPVEDLNARIPVDVAEIWQREWPDYN